MLTRFIDWRLDTTTARIVQMRDVVPARSIPRTKGFSFAVQGARGGELEFAVRALHKAFGIEAAPALNRFIAFDRQARTRYDRAFLMETWPRGRRHSPAKGACGLKLASRVRIPPSPPEIKISSSF